MKSSSSIDIKEHKKVEERLRESELMYQKIIDNLDVGFYQVTLDGKILTHNPTYNKILGIDISENLNNANVTNFWKKTELREDYLKQLLRDNIVTNYICHVIRKDGKKIILHLNSHLIRDKKGKPTRIDGTFIDVTERFNLEKKLIESEEKYRTIAEGSHLAISIMQDDIVKYANQKMADLTGYSIEEILSWKPLEFAKILAPDSLEQVIEQASKKQRGDPDVLVHYPINLKKKSGELIWVDNISTTIMYEGRPADLVTQIDITEQVEAQEELKESEEKYRTILESIKEGYFEVDLSGNFEFINNSLCEIIGYSKNELLSMNYENLCDEENKRFIFQTYNNLYKEGKGSTLFDFVQIKKNGERICEESSVYLKFNSQGEIIGFKGLIRDITERKKTEILRRKFQQELEKEVEYRTKELNEALEKQKLYLNQIENSSRFKTEFMATMSHELRTPLNAIIGFTDLLLENAFGELNEEQLEFVKDIDESSNHLLDMITNILDISRIESGQVTLMVEEIHLNNLVNHVISTLKPLYNEKRLIIDLKGLKKEQLIFADRIKFKQIIYNLFSNAIKFTEKGKVTFEFRDSKNTWEFIVKDTGIGIAEKDFNIIFKEFKRVKSAYIDSIPGSGLGLALTKRIVNLHGGDILFTSNLGKGTTFTFTIPKNLKKKVNSEKKVESFLSKL